MSGESDGTDYDLDAGPDPADVAAAAPEPDAPSDPVAAVGIGPGNPEYLAPRAERAIREADVLVGFETVVEFAREALSERGDGLGDTEVLACGYRDEAAALEAFADRVAAGARGTAALMGDPNHSGYQFVGKVERAVDRPVRVVPGVSSLQVAASRARTPMEDALFVTLHRSGDLGPDLDRLRSAVGERHLLVLPRPFDWMPGDVAATLLAAGAAPDLQALVCERLTHGDEAITRTTLGDLADRAGGGREETPFSDLSVLVVRRE